MIREYEVVLGNVDEAMTILDFSYPILNILIAIFENRYPSTLIALTIIIRAMISLN